MTTKFPQLHKGKRPVAIVSFAQALHERREAHRNEVETLMPVIGEAFSNIGITKVDVDFICSGSTDYLIGGPFSFVSALDAIGVWPPKSESHVEMDAAWALYEAWVALQDDDVDVALVYGFGKSSLGDVAKILALQLDPYVMAPLWPDPVSLAALQARALIDEGLATERDFAQVAARCRKSAMDNEKAQVACDKDVDELMDDDYVVAPLRRHALPPLSDGAAAIVLAVGDRALELCSRPAWITGIDHRIETHCLGARNLTVSTSSEQAAAGAGLVDGKSPSGRMTQVAELHTPFASQEGLIAKALGLTKSVKSGETQINPSGGPLAANALMAGGLIRFGEAASRIICGSCDVAVAHATAGPLLQQNMVSVLEGMG